MCERGINVSQMRLSLGQCGDALGMVQQWLEQLHHLADHGGLSASSAEIAQVTVMIGEARSKLERASDVAENGGTPDVTVERV
ncbi:MAG: hypothetical protein OEV43_00890 [Coriobacteriia bacterium]|nr:hypothetical protein [Coriobacteriia bacterium]